MKNPNCRNCKHVVERSFLGFKLKNYCTRYKKSCAQAKKYVSPFLSGFGFFFEGGSDCDK